MQFAEDKLVWLLFLLPLLGALRYFAYKRAQGKFAKIASKETILKIFPGYPKYASRNILFGLFSLSVFLCLICASLRPQLGFVWKESKRKGVDIIVALDTSASMRAKDVAPDRLERARREILDLLDALQGDRVALIAFAGTAFIEAPLTQDYSTFRLFLKTLDTDLIPIPGTNIAAALDKSIEAFDIKSQGTPSKKGRAILLISDGEDLEGDLNGYADKLKELNIRLYIMGIGTPAGSPIPSKNGFKKDSAGSLIISKLNEPLLKELAQKTGGIYVQSITSTSDTELLYTMGIHKDLEGNIAKASRAKRWNEYYQFPLFIAVFLLTLAALYRSNLTLFRKPKSNLMLALIAISLSFPSICPAQDKERLGKEASELYKKGDFEQAEKIFKEGNESYPSEYRYLTGLGATVYREGYFQRAADYFEQAFNNAQDPKAKGSALYNQGNAYVQLNLLKEAIKSYEESLKLIPEDKNTKENLEYAKRLLEQQKNPQQQKNNQQNSSQSKEGQNKNQSSSSSSQSSQSSQQQSSQNQSNSSSSQSSSDSSSLQQPNQGSGQSSSSSQTSGESSQEQSSSSQSQQSSGQEAQDQQQDRKMDYADSFEHKESVRQDKASTGQSDAILNSVEENKANLRDFREEQAKEDLKQQGRKIPRKDW